MKKIVLFLVINFSVFISILAQEIKLATPEQFKKFLNTTTYVVMSDNPFSEFNNVITESINKVWKLTPYKFIDNEEFDKLKINPNNSFIFLSEASFTLNNETIYVDILNITLGVRSGNLNLMPDLGSAPLAYLPEGADSDEIEEQYLYFIPGILRFFQYNIKFQANQTKVVDLNKLASSNKNLLTNKTIYFCQENLSNEVNNLANISKIYTGKVKITNKDEIYKLLLDGDPNAAVAFTVKTNGKTGLYCIKFIIDTDSGTLIYYDMHLVKNKDNDGFTANDFKKL